MMTEGIAEVNGARLWYRMSGAGAPIVQVHGSGFGHRNFDTVTPELARDHLVVDFDMRGYGRSERPVQRYDMGVWAQDVIGLMDALGIESAHVHGSSMGAMVSIVVAAEHPDRVRSVVINCAAAKLGRMGRMLFQGWIDLIQLDPDGVASRPLAEATAWQALSKRFLETAEGAVAVDHIHRILSESNDPAVFIAACEAIITMDLRPHLGRIRSPALVIGGDEDIMTPWDQGPEGAGQEAIHRAIADAEKHVIAGSGHSSMLDSTAEYLMALRGFLRRH